MEWIPITEKLPEIDQRVLAIGSGTHAIPCKFNEYFWRDVDLFADDRIIRAYYTSITHWMPLPSPPKQKDNA